ncbi:MAG TPA: exosortase-associated EpsI family protein [Candidatus Thermoplasmatota archaeon]|nr:exosortase-associated EpsI family protein [Candidatus Thermoplasmatota archaeon]
MNNKHTWRVIAGLVALLVVVALLLSPPSMIFAKAVSVVDTELRQSSGNEVRVVTKFDLGDVRQLNRLPKTLGNWTMSHQYAWDNIATRLDTDVLLSRDYVRPGLLQPVNLLIVQSGNVSSFHPAPVCYRMQGWTVPEEGKLVVVPIPNATFAQGSWLGGQNEVLAFNGEIRAKLLPVTKAATGNTTIKKVALYVYLKDEVARVTEDVTWVRVEVALPADAPDEEALPLLGELLGETVPQVFVFQPQDEPPLVAVLGERYGVAGFALVGALLAAPIGILGWASWAALTRRKA